MRLRLDPRDEDAADHRPRERRRARRTPSPGCGSINAGRGGIVDEDALADAIRDGQLARRRDRHVRDRADHRVAAVRARQRRRHAAPRCVDVRGAGQGGRDDRRAGRARAARRLRPVRRQRRRLRGLRDRAAVPAARRTARPAVHRSRRRVARRRSRSPTRARSPTTTAACSRSSVLKGVLGPVSDEPVTFVNAPQLAEERGIAVRETTSSDARDYVNLVTVRGEGGTHVAGDAVRQAGRAAHRRHRRPQRRPAAVAAPARRAQRGRAGDDRHGRDDPRRRGGQHLRHGRRSGARRGEAALMAIATDTLVPAEIVAAHHRERRRARPRVAIDLELARVSAATGAGRRPRRRRRST